jgi:hypothetical protein
MTGATATLPAELTAALASLNTGMGAKRIDRRALDAVLTALDTLDPACVPAAEASFRRHVHMPKHFWTSSPRSPVSVRAGPIWTLARWLTRTSPARPGLVYTVHRDGAADLKILAHNPDIAQIFLRHENGFVRQAALEAIPAAEPSPFAVASIVYRLNDWVAQPSQWWRLA